MGLPVRRWTRWSWWIGVRHVRTARSHSRSASQVAVDEAVILLTLSLHRYGYTC